MRMSSGKGVHLVRFDPFFLPLPRLCKPEQPEEHKEEESSLADQLERAYAMYQNRFTLQYTDVLLRTLSRKSWTWTIWWRSTLLVDSFRRRRRTMERGC